jgi:hypothetical protein
MERFDNFEKMREAITKRKMKLDGNDIFNLDPAEYAGEWQYANTRPGQKDRPVEVYWTRKYSKE